MKPKSKNRHRIHTSSKCWPKIVFLLTTVSTLLCIGCIVTMVIVTENVKKENMSNQQEESTEETNSDCHVSQTKEENSSTDLIPSYGSKHSEPPTMKTSNFSAHLTLKYFNDLGGDYKPNFTKGSVPLRFNPPSSMIHMNGLVLSHNNTGIIILNKGSYLVYSNIHFLVKDSDECGNYTEKIWKHVVKLTRAGNNATEDLLSGHHTCCDRCKRDRVTSHTAGVFQLNTNDSLRVEINGHGLVSCDYESNCFFGLVKLDASI